MGKFNIEENEDYISYRETIEAEKFEDEKKLQPTEELLEKVKEAAQALGEPQFTEDTDDALTFDYFVSVHEVAVRHAFIHLEQMMKDLRNRRIEAIESYEDELHDELVLQTVYLEQTVIEIFRDIVFPVLDLTKR